MGFKRKCARFAQIILLLAVSTFTVLAAGELDPAFNVAVYQPSGSSSVPPMRVQPDGKLIIAFPEFGVNNGIAAQGLTRFNLDGSVDYSFRPPRFTSGGIGQIALQSTGKILIRGNFVVENSPYKRIARLNTDGSIDTTFNVITTPLPREGELIYVLPDDSFITGTVYKFDANGVPNNTFQYQPYWAPATAIAGLPDGRVYVSFEVPMSSGFDYFTRHNADGTRDESFTGVQPNRNIRKIIPLPDGKILICGSFRYIEFPTETRGIARLNSNGTLDTTFNPGEVGVGGPDLLNTGVSDMELLPDGKILIGGSFETYNGVARRKIARLNADGTLDTAFNFNGYINPFSGGGAGDLEVRPDGKITASGFLYSLTQLRASVIILNPDGSQSSEFFIQKAALPQRVRKTTVQADGKIYVGGEYQNINGYDRSRLARLNADGTVDTSFNPFFNTQGGGATIIHQILVQPDGKILVSFSNGFVIVRLNSNGSRDTSFTTSLPSSAEIYDIALQADGKILYGGESSATGHPTIFGRLNANGSADASYNPPIPNDAVYRILVQPDGKSLICGEFTQIGAAARGRIARYNGDGTLDETFAPTLGANSDIHDIDLQTDGKIIIGGSFSAFGGDPQVSRVGRLNANGVLDTSFAQNVDAIVQTVKAQPDGKILIGGSFTNVGGTPRERLARLNVNGSLDLTFNASANAFVFDINLQADGKILVAGDFFTINNTTKLGIARLLNNTVPRRTPFDYDGDGRSDISVFRPAENKWYILLSSNLSVIQPAFGAAGDIPTPSDFDGDGKTDLAVFRPSAGDWWYQSSVSGNQVNVHFGQAGDIPRPSDFDGDGKTDFVVYRPSNSVWYRLGTTGQTSVTQFGIAEDKPLVGDFDGDGKSDLAVFRPSTGDWWYAASASNGLFSAVHWGQSGDIPVPGDYDADGKTDFVVYRPSNGGWYILRTGEQNYTILQFGLAEDKPVGGDYDGDGKMDVAVWRPSTGVWYLLQTTSGFGAVQFGAAGDVPTENAFLP